MMQTLASLSTMWPRGDIRGIGASQEETTASDGDFPRSAKAGQDCNAVPKEESRCLWQWEKLAPENAAIMVRVSMG